MHILVYLRCLLHLLGPNLSNEEDNKQVYNDGDILEEEHQGDNVK